MKLIAQFFLGVLVILIFTGGKPSGFTVGLSFFSGVIFLAWKEKLRLTELKKKTENNSLIINSENQSGALSLSSEKTLDLQKVKLTGPQESAEHEPKTGASKKSGLLELSRPQLDYANHSLEELTHPVKLSDNKLFQGILASWVDGVLILTEQGKLIQANEMARQICDRLTPNSPFSNQAPKDIWQVCQVLIDSRSQSPNAPIGVESEFKINKSACFRIRVRWFKFGESASPHLLVILEDRGQSIQNQAIAEAEQYDLSPREAEVWSLYRKDYTFKEISEELYISLNTVKKHIKNIRTKRQMALLQRKSLLR